MRNLILALLLALTVTVSAETPTVNIPQGLRTSNWVGNEREGSCVHAAIVNLFTWQNEPEWADYWRVRYSNGEFPDDSFSTRHNLARKLTNERITFAYTLLENDVAFLEWAIKTRRGCGVTVQGGKHMVVLVHLDSQWAAVLDSNDVSDFVWMPRNVFLAEWKASNSWAVTPVLEPVPPLEPQ